MSNGESQSSPPPSGANGGAVVKVCPSCRGAFRTRRDTCPKDNTQLIPAELAAGTMLAGKYRIIEQIGRGGMGVVYLAEHIIMGKKVAIKVIHPLLSLDETFLDMFKAEARHAATFKHDNVLTVHDFGEAAGRFYMVMELVDGESLKKVRSRLGSLPPLRALAILINICDAVAAAHAAGIVHLDLTPANVFLSETADGDAIKVLDFGLAKLKGDTATEFEDGMTVGTVGYMAPEQILGGHVDERTDVYSIGVMAFELLTGKLPFVGEDKEEVLDSQLAGKTIKFPKSAVLKTISKETTGAVMAAIEANPDKRPESVSVLGQAFRDELKAIENAVHKFAHKHEADIDRREKRGSFARKVRSVLTVFRKSAGGPPAPKGMVCVPEGEFIRGSAAGAPDEKPMLKVRLPALFIDITPVTNLQYAMFVQATDHRPPTTWKTISFPPGTGELPVTGVSWRDARAYAHWAGKRLPTESEWEKAGRGADGRPYPWGRKWEAAHANWGGNPRFYGGATIQPVGSFPRDRSPYGCLDMAGNVREWTASWYKPYGPTEFKSDDFGEKFRVVRGGSYLSLDKAYLRCSCRSHARPDDTGDIGFRCVLDVPEV